MGLRWRVFARQLLLVGLCGVVTSVVADAAAKEVAADPAQQQQPAEKKKSRARQKCAPELGLLTTSETSRTYARDSQRFCNASSPWAEKQLPAMNVLGFVAPWNDHGYRAARYFRGKLSAIAPLWFRVLPAKRSKDTFEIAGDEIAMEQHGWLRRVTGGYADPAAYAHFSLEGFANASQLKRLLEDPTALTLEVLVICERHNFDGVIFDIRGALFPKFKYLLPGFTSAMSIALRAVNLKLTFSVPVSVPPSETSTGPLFTSADASALAGRVDALIVGTRDYSRSEPGPSAPSEWVRASMRRLLQAKGEDGTPAFAPDQLMLEIPTYGRAFKGSEGRIILTPEIAKAMARERPELEWDDEAQEHFARLASSDTVIYMPTLAFLNARLLLAKSLGVGVALRELGAGLDYTFDLLPRRGAREASHEATEASHEAPEHHGRDGQEL